VDWFYLYFVGFLVLIAAIGMGMNMIGIGAQWIFVVCLALFGIAVMSAVKRTRGGSEGDGP
jgi:cobalamin synthase